MKFLLAIIFFLFLTTPLFGQSKQTVALAPMGALGDLNETDKRIIFNSLQESLSKYYRLTSQKMYEKAEEEAFQQMEADECTEDQCIAIIQELLQVEYFFLFELLKSGEFQQMKITRVDLDGNRDVRTVTCEKCGIAETNSKVDQLVLSIFEQFAVDEKKITQDGSWTEPISGMKFLRIPRGTFLMGSPPTEVDRDADRENQHTVKVSEFQLSENEVTLGQFRQFVSDSGYQPESERRGCWFWNGKEWEESLDKNWIFTGYSQNDSHPVACVSWNDATAYAEWLSKKTGKRFSLPTEAEWEYAARAGTTTARYWGDGIGSNYANCTGCGSRWDNQQTAPVGSFAPNAFGLYDMLGNIWEWTCSEYKKSFDGSEERCSGKAQWYSRRGGSWFYYPGRVRAAYRAGHNPYYRNFSSGFRIALASSGIRQQAKSNSVWTEKTVYSIHEPIKVMFAGLPGNKDDWITIVKKGSVNTAFKEYFYSKGETQGTRTFKGLPRGKYEVRLFLDWSGGGGYSIVGRYFFEVR